MQTHIFVVEDDEALSTLLCYNLEAEGFKVTHCARGDHVEQHIDETPPDLLVLDWMLPGLSGIEICRILRQRNDTVTLPIILLTARGEENDRIRGLSIGADDYVVKPFSVPELIARIHALLRRTKPALISDLLESGDLLLDRTLHRVSYQNQDIHLGPKEYRLLEFFMQNLQRVYSRDQLLDHVWGRDVFVDARTVDVHVGRLRKALKKVCPHSLIRTVRGAGYAFDPD